MTEQAIDHAKTYLEDCDVRLANIRYDMRWYAYLKMFGDAEAETLMKRENPGIAQEVEQMVSELTEIQIQIKRLIDNGKDFLGYE
jgi:hypothetical protein